MGGGIGSGATVTPGQLTDAAHALQSSVPPHLRTAEADLQQATGIEYSNFTAVAPFLAAAYVAACQFADKDLEHKKKVVEQIRENLVETARTWTAAEHKSTTGHH